MLWNYTFDIGTKSIKGQWVKTSWKKQRHEWWIYFSWIYTRAHSWSFIRMFLKYFYRPCTVLELLWAKQGKSEGFHSCDRPINLKLDSNRRIFSLCDLEISWMASKNNRALLLYYVELCVSFQIHQWIQSGVTVLKRSIRVEIGNILSGVTLKFHWWAWKTIGHLFYTTLSFVYHFKAMGEFNLEVYSPETLNSGQNRQFVVPCDLEVWWLSSKNKRAPLLCCFKLCA